MNTNHTHGDLAALERLEDRLLFSAGHPLGQAFEAPAAEDGVPRPQAAVEVNMTSPGSVPSQGLAPAAAPVSQTAAPSAPGSALWLLGPTGFQMIETEPSAGGNWYWETVDPPEGWCMFTVTDGDGDGQGMAIQTEWVLVQPPAKLIFRSCYGLGAAYACEWIVNTGTVFYSGLEGGFWYIDADGEGAYVPMGGLSAEFQQEGLRVQFSGYERVDMMSIYYGRVLELDDIARHGAAVGVPEAGTNWPDDVLVGQDGAWVLGPRGWTHLTDAAQPPGTPHFLVSLQPPYVGWPVPIDDRYISSGDVQAFENRSVCGDNGLDEVLATTPGGGGPRPWYEGSGGDAVLPALYSGAGLDIPDSWAIRGGRHPRYADGGTATTFSVTVSDGGTLLLGGVASPVNYDLQSALWSTGYCEKPLA